MTLKKFATMEEALNFVTKNFKLMLNTEVIGLDLILKRVSAEEIVAPTDIPQTDRSAVDGYAICSSSVSSATPNNPIPLNLKERNLPKISCGDAVPVHTGDPLPEGADAVVMLEDAEIENNKLFVMKSVAKYENVSRKGEDFERGKIVVERGTLLRPWHIASLSALNITKAKVFKKVRLGIVVTGSELSEPGGDGPFFDSTSRLIAGYLLEQGYIDVNRYGIIEDDVKSIATAIRRAEEENDLILTTGGTGPGLRDLSVKALEEAGGTVVIRGLAIRPGRPTSLGVLNKKPVFMLSGYPVAAMIGLRFLVLPFIEGAIGLLDHSQKFVFAKLSTRVFNEVGLESFIRVKLKQCGSELCAEPMLLRGSGILSSLLTAGGFLRIPRNVEGYEVGELVKIDLV
jgi:molybdopterin molybdotransferase